MSISRENYLKALLKLAEKNRGGFVSTKSLAEALETTPPSVSDMLKKLRREQYIEYKPYQGARLTEKGKKKALRIIRSHRLWEFFLVKHLGISWKEVHRLAEELEHISEEKLLEALDRYLEYPAKDPHGEPIPDASGKWRFERGKKLTDIPAGKTVEICGLDTDRPAFLNYIERKKLLPGTRIRILENDPYDQTLILRVKKKKLGISYGNARKIYVHETEK